jgi:hypothetical protein
MKTFFALEFTHPAPEVIEVEYKHAKCGVCGIYPVDRVGGTGVRFARKSELADFSRTAQGILARQSVVDHLIQAHISGWRPGCVQVKSASKLHGQDTHYYELVIVGHTVGYSERVQLEIEKKCEECGRRRFAYPQTGLVLPEECWDGSDIFVIEELGVRVVTEAFRQVIEKHQHSGLEFVPLDEWRDPFGSLND